METTANTISDYRRRGKKEIQAKANEVLKLWFRHTMKSACRFPWEELLHKLETEYNTRIITNAELQYSYSSRSKVLGCLTFNPRIIYLDKALEGDIRKAFVVAHEFGHLVLHRKFKIEEEIFDTLQLTEKEKNPNAIGKEWTIAERMEWEANYFASCLLMPTNNFVKALTYAQRCEKLSGELGKIFVYETKDSEKELDKTLKFLSVFYGVSKHSVLYKAIELDLIIMRVASKDGSSYTNTHFNAEAYLSRYHIHKYPAAH